MPAQRTSSPLDVSHLSLRAVHCDEGLENLESFHRRLPFLFRHRYEIWRHPAGPRLLLTMRFSFVDRNPLDSSLARLPPNDRVQAGIINNDVSSATPLNRATWKEFE